MKKTLFLALAVISAAAFTGCDNDDDATKTDMRVLTFEDADARFAPYAIGNAEIRTWSDLIDDAQYDGALLYTHGNEYRWCDDGNTGLGTEPFVEYYGATTYTGGGHAVSNHASTDIAANGTYAAQLTVYGESGHGGHNSSKNFCVHNGASVSLVFAAGMAHMIDHMWINSTTYFLHAYAGNGGFTAVPTEESWCRIVATGYDAAGRQTGTSEFWLARGTEALREWTKWSLAPLGKIQKVTFTVEGSDVGDWGLNTPAYFAYDDVAVTF